MSQILHYETYGEESEEIIVIVHGLFGSLRNWTSISKEFSERRQVIAVDLRNHGESFHSDSMEYEEMANDLAALLASYRDKKICLIGHSMGGKTAMSYALKYHPDNLNYLIVVDIAPVAYEHLGFYEKLFPVLNALPISSQGSKSNLLGLLNDSLNNMMLSQFLLTNLQRKEIGYDWKINLPVIWNSIHSLIGFPDFEGITYRGKTFFIRGGKSDYIKPHHDETIKKRFSDSRLEVLPDAGHWVHSENRVDFMHSLSNIIFEYPKTNSKIKTDQLI